MHILITGGTGKVGSRTAQYLARRHNVRLLVRTAAQKTAAESQGFDAAVGDVTQPETLRAGVRGIDAVAHFAAFFRGATPEQMDAVNHRGTIALAQACIEADVERFVFASTTLVYGPGTGRPKSESDIPQPQFPYPVTKLAAETALMSPRQSTLRPRILRLAFVYGDGDPHLKEFSPWLHQRPSGSLFHLIHHEDVARATELALRRDGTPGQIYNVGDDKPLHIREILRILGEPSRPEDGQLSEAPQWDDVVDTARIRSELGFRPIIPSLRDAVAENRL